MSEILKIEKTEKEFIGINYGIKVFEEFDDTLILRWSDLYNKGANYNLSHEWCQLWFKYFAKKQKLHIITFWEDRDLKLLAPFQISRGRLSLIGTKPDLYDEFNILYQDSRYIDKLLEYIDQNKLEINFKHINSETEIAKHLIKRFYTKAVRQISHVTETKPYISGSFSTKNTIESDIKRCRKNAIKQYKEDFAFEYSVENKQGFIDEFISFHTYRWNGGMFVKKANLINFFKDVLLNTNSAILSRLYFPVNNKTAAFGFGYLDSNNKYWYSMTAYNHDYKKVSPGKVMLFDMITESFNRGIMHFDFGRGSEAYKNWFSNSESILFNIATYKHRVMVVKIRTLVEKILKKIYG
ncbi:MAG: hypothetical protein A2287_05100 [Candidatus Melainabacteria bacterium RIFOXYA12_FULL_32_12]|nr:MAG: hypothetical protein A2255_00655 [Candidatus Melainabacteria bacterium RIFOXYA2_FULL_32_9]OGI28870.1 MAG: hypothetical protein A2287_05100 [Candidatus Melainabacteria bacterium RIFOXYA12_FULL_32_12]